jgi:hypothetical protein
VDLFHTLFEAVRFLDKRVIVHGLASKPQYNGRQGSVVDVHASGRYEVLLDAIKSETGSKIEFVAVHLLLHCKNLHIL